MVVIALSVKHSWVSEDKVTTQTSQVNIKKTVNNNKKQCPSLKKLTHFEHIGH